MSKHTPGPWEIAPRIAKYSVIPANDHERGQLERIGALTFDALSIGTPNGQVAIIPLDESSRGNATLIVGAKDLREALVDLIHQMNQPPGPDGSHKLNLNKALNAIRKTECQS